MDKGLTVPKWVLINRPKIPQMSRNLYAQIVCPSPKVWDFDEKRLHWASVVRELNEFKKNDKWFSPLQRPIGILKSAFKLLTLGSCTWVYSIKLVQGRRNNEVHGLTKFLRISIIETSTNFLFTAASEHCSEQEISQCICSIMRLND